MGRDARGNWKARIMDVLPVSDLAPPRMDRVLIENVKTPMIR